MKNLFSGYYNVKDAEFKDFWANATFVFDTNVLLNLYRYQSKTTQELLKAIKKLSKQIWIPHHVALEFQRNRLAVIAQQHNRFSEVKSIVENAISTMSNKLDDLQLKTKHSHIDPDQLLTGIKKAKDEYYKSLEKLEKDCLQTTSEDNIRNQLDSLFKNKVGEPPKNQEYIDSLNKEGEERYKNNIPPGFKDANKNSEDSEYFIHSKIKYQKKFGDLLIWKQLIDHSLSKSLKDVIFITDDTKSDWWLNIKGKTLGARPELIDEIKSFGGVERFHMYGMEAFLQYANTHLGAKVDKDIIAEVKDVVNANNSIASIYHDAVINDLNLTSGFYRDYNNKYTNYNLESGEKAIFNWLTKTFPNIKQNSNFPDFISQEGNVKLGFEIKALTKSSDLSSYIDRTLSQAYASISKHNYNYSYNFIDNSNINFTEIWMIFMIPNSGSITAYSESITGYNNSNIRMGIKTYYHTMPSNVKLRIIIGNPGYVDNNGLVTGFTKIEEFIV